MQFICPHCGSSWNIDEFNTPSIDLSDFEEGEEEELPGYE